MILSFKKVILHNFGSYGHSELDLENKGFCLVTGKNNCEKDNAESNGSGKSFLFSSICWALTGETISGVTSNLKNINIEEDLCYVTLFFDADRDSYEITRYYKPKSDMHIVKNGEDISGKGIMESKKILQQHIPDLTKDLIASCILLGQGMPNKLSSFTPSGRKELLENLTKTNDMIEEIKLRLQKRFDIVNLKIREIEDSAVVLETESNGKKRELESLRAEFDRNANKDYDTLILCAANEYNNAAATLDLSSSKLEELNNELSSVNNSAVSIGQLKSAETQEEFQKYTSASTELNAKLTPVLSNITSTSNEIYRRKNIKDTCPTCGQKLPGVVVMDTSELEEELQNYRATESEIKEELSKIKFEHDSEVRNISAKYDAQLSSAQAKISSLRAEIGICSRNVESARSLCYSISSKKEKLEFEKENYEKYLCDLTQKILDVEAQILKLSDDKLLIAASKDNMSEHLAILKRIDTLVKRDFRGYLLENVISYLNKKAKDYCKIVFGTDELVIETNGNNLDISYGGKMLEVLSGGERQRVDIILQFAIRDLLTTYMNYSSNILVLDEVTDFLDKSSCEAVMNLITKELTDVESVFIISHRSSELQIPIDTDLVIVKDELGISEIA